MSAVSGLQVLADLAQVQCPDEDSCVAWFLLGIAEDVTSLVPAHADMSWRVEAALTAVAHRLASALVAEALAARWDYAV